MQIVYASERPSDLGDRIFKNPRHFLAVDPKATKVIVVGDWKNVVAAYEAAKVPVTQIQPGDPLTGKPAPAAREAKPATAESNKS